MNSIEIAQKVEMRHMRRFMEDLDLTDDDFEFYGKYTGKIRLETIDKFADRPDGKLILVTAMTPTKFGEGKTLTSIGLGQALAKIGKKGMLALREPSLGPVFGIKGGATGGGYSQLVPMEKINLHFNGDIHAITTAPLAHTTSRANCVKLTIHPYNDNLCQLKLLGRNTCNLFKYPGKMKWIFKTEWA